MHLENLQAACVQLRSGKGTERKKGAERVLDLLNDSENLTCKLLDSNSLSATNTRDKDKGKEAGVGGAVTWAYVFGEVKEYFAKETEKLTTGQAHSVAKSFCFHVVDSVFQKGTSRRPWIGWKQVLEFLSTFLNSDVHLVVYGGGLLTMLRNFLLIDYYLQVVEDKSWIDLTRLLLKLYGRSRQEPFTLLQCIKICVREGSNHQAVIGTLRKEVVEFYVSIFMNDKDRAQHRPYMALILNGLTTLCRKNALEFRGILCNMGESIIPKIQIHLVNYTEEEKAEIIEFLLIQVQLHCPCDSGLQDIAFLAEDERGWKEILQTVYSFCIDTLEAFALKKQSQFNKGLQLSQTLLLLAAKVTMLISDVQEEDHFGPGDEDDPNPSKKMMRYNSFSSLLGKICSNPNPSESQIVWMNYFTAVLNRFPQLTENQNNFSSLFVFGTMFLRSPFATKKDVYLYLLTLLDAEKYSLRAGTIPSRSNSWDSVWDLTLRSLSVCEYKPEALELLRRLLVEVQPSNVHSLLLLYTGGTIPLSPASLSLLTEYLARCSLPSSLGFSNMVADTDAATISCPRSSLIWWLMNSTFHEQILGQERLMAVIIFSLLVRQTHNLVAAEDYRSSNVSLSKKEEDVYEDFELQILTNCFVHLPKSQVSGKNIEDEREQARPLKVSLVPFICTRLLEYLKHDYGNLPTFAHSAVDFMKKIVELSYHAGLYLNLVNLLEKYFGGSRSGDEFSVRTNLEHLFSEAMIRCVENFVDFVTKGKSKTPMQVYELICILRNVFRSSQWLCDGVKVMLAQRFSQQLQELLKKIYRSNFVRYVERANEIVLFPTSDYLERFLSCGGRVEEHEEVCEGRQIELAAIESLRCLLDYGFICDHRLDLFSDILRDCVSEAFSSSLPFMFDFSEVLVSGLIPIIRSTSRGREYSEVLTLITNVLQKMCKGFYLVPSFSARLWKLFHEITAVTSQDSDINQKNLMILVGTLFGFLRGDSPQGSHLASITVRRMAFRTLNELARNDPQMRWSVFQHKNGAECWILNETYQFLTFPSHEVQVLSADTICTMFENGAHPGRGDPAFADRITSRPPSLEAFFDIVYEAIQKAVTLPRDLSPTEATEETANRTSIALGCLSRLVFAHPYMQTKAIFSFLQLIRMKVINANLANRALQFASATATRTMCCHISFLLHEWLNTHGYPIGEFPYQLFGCESMNAFYAQFRKEITVEFFIKKDTEGLSRLSRHFHKEIVELIKDCYGMIMARIIPGIAVYKLTNQHLPGRDNAQLVELRKRLNSMLGTQAETLMMTKMDDVVLQLVSLVFNPHIPSTWGIPSVKLPEPSSLYYDEGSVDQGFTFLKEVSSKKDVSLISALAVRDPRGVYEIMLTLTKRIHGAHDSLEKLWRLHQFSYFISLILREQPHVFSMMKEYVCSFVIYGYIRLLNSECGRNEYDKYVREAIVHLLSQFVLSLTFSYKDEMKQHFYVVVNNLVVAGIKYDDALLPSVQKILDIVFENYDNEYADCIVSLDPFPKGFEKYKEIYLTLKYGADSEAPRGCAGLQWPLHKELRSCLSNVNEKWTLERLEWIRELLSQKKRDLDKLVKYTDGKKFSNECWNDILHMLIQQLLSIIKSAGYGDSNMINEAARCLGEIGPVDLSVLVLPPKLNKRKDMKGLGKSWVALIETLAEYLKSDDIELVSASGNVLRSMCHVTDIAEVIAKDPQIAKTRLDGLLKPFKSAPPQSPGTSPALIRAMEKVLPGPLETKLGLNELDEEIDYSSWIIQLTCGLLECFKEEESVVRLLRPVCHLKVEFCEEFLPFIFHLLLYSGRTNPVIRKTVGGYFRNFFVKCIGTLANQQENTRSITPVMGLPTTEGSIFTNKLALRSLLGVIQFLRHHQAPPEYKGSVKMTPWDNNFWLELNYFDLAKVAQHCGAYLTSILFVEIAVTQTEMDGSGSHLAEDSTDDDIMMDSYYSQGTTVLPSRTSKAELYERLLLKAYTSIGEPDAVCGCGSARFSSEGNMNISHLQQRTQYYRVISACDGTFPVNVGESMRDLALYNTLWTYLQGIEAEEKVLDPELSEIQYECGWRLSKWDLRSDKATYLKDGSFFDASKGFGMLQQFIYSGVQTGLAKDFVNHVDNIRNGYQTVAKQLRHASIESSENLYGFLSQFQMLRLLEDFFEEEKKTDNIQTSTTIDRFLQKWRIQDRISHADFKFQEPVLSLRNVLLRSYCQKNPRLVAAIDSAYDDSVLELLTKARDIGRIEFAENCVGLISSPDKAIRRDLEIAKNYWARRDHDIARQMLHKLIKRTNETYDLYPNMLLQYGEWLSESLGERPAVILEKYLSKSCQIFEKRGIGNQTEGAKAHFTLAKYADEQYQNTVKYMKSDLFTEKLAYVEKAKKDYEASVRSTDQEVRRSLMVLSRQTKMEEEEIRAIGEERNKFLVLALRHYLKGLKDSNDNDLLIFRLVALWLENAESTDMKLNQEVNEIMKSEALNVPLYKYIVVLHQLSARLSGAQTSTNTRMLDNLKHILLSCTKDHPYHALPVLLTQSLLHEDQIAIKGNKGKKAQHIEDRVVAATKLVDGMKRDKTLGLLTNKMLRLWQSLIQLANVKEESNSTNPSVLIPNSADIKRIIGLDIVPVPTVLIPISPSGEYSNFVGIKGFDATYALVGGINFPKRLSCFGTDGNKYNMLLKGNDDLRQDAVMQQVFTVMNKLLLNEPKTKARRLHVRTYKVVPLSQRSGVLEWCENSITLGDYLSGDNGAHQRYRPTDFTPLECRKKMVMVKDCGDNEKKYSTFMTILEHFRPVFRHFFFENFKEAGIFFERRLAYTRSVATNSMVGYILGLGDRHVLNILVDKTTAELIHIDLGVAFEQGRILPTPETIPFRLTRDIVDGMGATGIEGVFRKCCEMTLEVLRSNSEIIMTILEVLLYDPLYMWTLTADRVKKVQPADSNRPDAPLTRRISISTLSDTAAEDVRAKERNSSAARVLLRLRQKLAGIEEGSSAATSLSVAGHVALLLQRAMDPERLSRLFPGWQPYL